MSGLFRSFERGSRPRHPLFDVDLDAPTVIEAAEEVTVIVKRADGQTLTAVFKGDRLETGVCSSSEVEYDEDIPFRDRIERPSPARHYNLRLDILRGSTVTFTTTNATQEAAV